MLSTYFYDVKLRIKQLWKKTYCKISASKNCRMAQEWIWLVQIIAYKGRPFSVFVDGFVSHFAFVQQPPCTVIFEISRSNRMMTAILNLLMRSDREDGYLKMCTRSLTAKRWQNIVPNIFPNFYK